MPDFLRKHGTEEVFIRTDLLAARKDMYPVSEAEAKACMRRLSERQVAEARLRSDKGQIAPVAEPAKPAEPASTAEVDQSVSPQPSLDDMSDDELRGLAAERKIYIHHACKRDTIIAKLKNVEVASPEPEPEATPESPTAPGE
jgi:hypothetical protein